MHSFFLSRICLPCLQATFAVGIVTAVLGLVATVYISDENRRKVAGVIWLVVLLPLTGFAYNYNMLAVSLKSGAVPSHMTLADLIAEDETVGGLNVQRIASSSVAELIHISEDIGALSHLVHLMLAKAANGGRRQKANMAHGLKGIFGDFAPASLVHNSLLVPPRKAAEGERGGGERGEGEGLADGFDDEDGGLAQGGGVEAGVADKGARRHRHRHRRKHRRERNA